jgi:hypothetical protein
LLDDHEIERYARQIVVPGIGAAGQEKLLNSTVLIVGHPRGCATAALFLRAAGVNVISELKYAASDAIVISDTNALDAATYSRLTSTGRPICWYALANDACITGIHPLSPVPLPVIGMTAGDSPLHDAAASDAAAAACAILSGIECRSGPFRFQIG